MRVLDRAGLAPSARLRDCLESLDPSAPEDYRELAAALACTWRSHPPGRVGLAGGQGAGKSTLAELIEAACRRVGLRACSLSLDDFYRTRAERRELARRVHPLFETRGPPGTHDMVRCRAALASLQTACEVTLPVFDKGFDDRVGTRTLEGPFDVVVLEGWCVGARPVTASELARPINELERELDTDARWRTAVNARLARDYGPIWQDLDRLIFLRVPGLEAVRRWRLAQEAARPPALRMDPEEIARFVQHYERITSWMRLDLPGRADLVVDLDDEHRVSGLSDFSKL
jgi:D-glycerate 3-kinase